jgi:putative intracellular protease/amidase
MIHLIPILALTSPAIYSRTPMPVRALGVGQLKRVAIMIFPGVQIIDYTGPYEVFGQAGFQVFTVAANPNTLTTNMGMRVTPNYTFANCPKPDVIVLPGGSVPDKAKPDDVQVAWIKQMVRSTPRIMSVCNGAFWLANAHLLDGKEATTFYGALVRLQSKFPKIHVDGSKRFADNGQIMCTAGLSSGIDGALRVVEKMKGLGFAKSVALGMEYNWQPNSDFARGAFADKYVVRLPGQGITLPRNATAEVVDVTDNRDLYHKSWRITNANASIATMMGRIGQQFATHWNLKRSAAGRLRGEVLSDWRFNGDDGRPWTCHLSMRPDGGHMSAQILSIQIHHTDTKTG